MDNDTPRSYVKFLATDEKREICIGYALAPFGTKGEYLKNLGVKDYQVRRWTAALIDGDLDNGKIPRHLKGMKKKEANEITKLRTEVAQLKNELARKELENRRLGRANDNLGNANKVLESANDVLGKAISALQDHSDACGKADDTSTRTNNNATTDSAS